MSAAAQQARRARALEFLAGLKVGDEVMVDATTGPVTVQKTLHHADGFGETYSQQVSVGYGPGRWNRMVSANALAAGLVHLHRAPTPDQSFCDVALHQQCSGYTEDEGDPETCMCSCHDPSS